MTGRDPQFSSLAKKAAAPYLQHGRFAQGFAHGKLTNDPIFEFVLREGLLAQACSVVDLGCGQGVLASLLQAAREAHVQGTWPGDWKPAPRMQAYTGIELMARDIERAGAVAGPGVNLVCGDIATTALPKADAVVIFDVLHYLPYDSQERVLNVVRTALDDEGVLLLRIGDAGAGWGFKMSQWTDRVITWCRGHRVSPTFCRPLSDWQDMLAKIGFSIRVQPMSQGTLFANVLLIATPSATADNAVMAGLHNRYERGND